MKNMTTKNYIAFMLICGGACLVIGFFYVMLWGVP